MTPILQRVFIYLIGIFLRIWREKKKKRPRKGRTSISQTQISNLFTCKQPTQNSIPQESFDLYFNAQTIHYMKIQTLRLIKARNRNSSTIHRSLILQRLRLDSLSFSMISISKVIFSRHRYLHITSSHISILSR